MRLAVKYAAAGAFVCQRFALPFSYVRLSKTLQCAGKHLLLEGIFPEFNSRRTKARRMRVGCRKWRNEAFAGGDGVEKIFPDLSRQLSEGASTEGGHELAG